MIDTNAHNANEMAVVRGPILLEWLGRHPGESAVRVHADEPDGIACAAQTLDQVNAPEPRQRDSGATPARWVRLV